MMTQKDQVVVYAGRDAWMVQSRGPIAVGVRALFGTDTLPTPFTLSKPRAEVVAEIKRLNPGVEILEA